ncbi:MAG: hypothetical protein U0R44_07315 [Candidatus Micrarchaeia archaeon]
MRTNTDWRKMAVAVVAGAAIGRIGEGFFLRPPLEERVDRGVILECPEERLEAPRFAGALMEIGRALDGKAPAIRSSLGAPDDATIVVDMILVIDRDGRAAVLGIEASCLEYDCGTGKAAVGSSKKDLDRIASRPQACGVGITIVIEPAVSAVPI